MNKLHRRDDNSSLLPDNSRARRARCIEQLSFSDFYEIVARERA